MSRLLRTCALVTACIVAPGAGAQVRVGAGVAPARAAEPPRASRDASRPVLTLVDVHAREPGRGRAGGRRPLWPWFALGGAALGAGAAAAWVLSSCDAGCRDDGGQAIGIVVYVPAGAIAGALLGAIIGRHVDSRR
jgi:hypothetical protein